MREKINLNEARRLNAILNGKLPKPSRHQAKLKSVLEKMKNAEADPGLETNSHLFFYKNRYYHVSGSLKKILSNEAEQILKNVPGTKVYFLCAEKICPMPNTLSGREMEGCKVKNDAGAVALMTAKTGVTITVKDL